MEAEILDLSTKKVWTLNDFCNYTGFSKSAVYKLTMDNKVEHSKPTGKSIFFDRDKVLIWLMSNPVKTDAQRKQVAANYINKM